MKPDADTRGIAEEADSERRALIAHTRHELRTPLNAVIGYSEMLLEDACQRGRSLLVPDLYRIHEAGLQLNALVNDILDPGKIESALSDPGFGGIEGRLRSRLRAPLDIVIARSGALLDLARSTHYDDSLADLTHIRQAGTELQSILARGVPLVENRFNSSASGPPSSTAYSFLSTVFTTSSASRRLRPTAPAADGASLLVVDDQETNRDILSRYLRRHGHQVTAATGGREALTLLADHRFDLILLDVVMPDMNGYEVLEALKSNDSLNRIPVILISALDDTLGKVEAFRAGGVDYVTKPFQAEEVIARVENQLRLSRLQQDLARQNEELLQKNKELTLAQKRTDMVFSALAEALPGTVLDGKYRLDEKIGAGGFGAVYRGRHLGLDQPVAIKIFRPTSGNDTTDALERFRQEGIAASRIKHPNTVEILDNGISSTGIAYLVMELLQGHTLAAALRDSAVLPLQRTIEILVPVCETLAEFHAAGIVHRDVKPSNIFLHSGRNGEVVKLLDFGMSKMWRATIDQTQDTTTISGFIAGTPSYMSPERLLNRHYDGRSDVYSVGVILYRMLSGKLPFQSEEGSDFEQVMMKLTAEPPSLRAHDPVLPQGLDELVSRMLSKDPQNRPEAKDLAALLQACI